MSNEVLGNLGDTIFDIVFGFFNGMISILTGGQITEFLGGYSDLESFWGDIEAWLIDEVINGIQGVADFTQAAWIDNMNTSHAGLMDVLDLSNYIEKQFELFYNESQQSSGDLIYALNRDYERDRETGAALTDFALRLMVNKSDALESYAGIYYDSLMESQIGTSTRFTIIADETMSFVSHYLAADLQAVENLSDLEASAAADAILAVAREDAAFVQEWFLETVVKPISYGENMAWALDVSSQYDIEDIMAQMEAIAVETHKRNLEMVLNHEGETIETSA